MNEESKAVNCAAVKPEEIGQRRGHGDVGRLRNKKIQEFGGDVELHELGQVGRAIRCEGGVHEDGESHSRQLKRLKKAGRYLKGVEKVTWKMGAWQNNEEVNVDVHVDSNWASGPERKSTSGGMMMINGTVVKRWSRTQATRALSTAEAEYYAVFTGAAGGDLECSR